MRRYNSEKKIQFIYGITLKCLFMIHNLYVLFQNFMQFVDVQHIVPDSASGNM